MEKMGIILAIMPREAPALAGIPFTLGYMGYRITAGRLMRETGLNMHGGILIICDAGLTEDEIDIRRFGGDATAEIDLRGAVGIVADFYHDTAVTREIVRELGRVSNRRGIPLYVPETFAETCPEACVMIPSAITEGSLKDRLQAASKRYGEGHTALEIMPMRVDYTLPAENHEGKRLSGGELEELMKQMEPMSFFSTELCAKYFTYIASDRSAHFVLYDDASTVVQKLRVAEKCGAAAAFLLYAEVSGMLGEIQDALSEA